MTSPLTFAGVNHTEAQPYRAGRMPHPEILMDYIAEGLGPRAWRFQVKLLRIQPARPVLTP